MLQPLNRRPSHYALLLLVASLLMLPNLGAPSLWDIDEGNNAEAAREMLDAENWVIPTFNFQLRTDKPALLYWLQIGAYQVFGVNEFAARLPSALAAIIAVLVVYELGRRLFGPRTALLAGLILATNGSLCAAGHFANPDALLHLCTALAFFFFWRGYALGRGGWFVPFGIATGFGMLAKGPVALVLPAATVTVFLLWTRRLSLLFDRRYLLGSLAFALVVIPWYAYVGSETKGEFLRGFFLTHNVQRALGPMEQHGGPAIYYLLVLSLGFAPWSVFLGPTLWYASGRRARFDALPDPSAASTVDTHADAYRFLWSWIGVYFLFFTLAQTKLPNYILPLYPAVALLTARFLERWRVGALRPPAWVLPTGLFLLLLLGAATTVGFLITGGAFDLEALRGRVYPQLKPLAALGGLIGAGTLLAWWQLRQGRRETVLAILTGTAVLFFACVTAWAGVALNGAKAPGPLAAALPSDHEAHEVRLAAYQYFQPSLVFYCHREVHEIANTAELIQFLRRPLPSYLFIREDVWQALETQIPVPHRIVARHRDLYRNCEVVLVTNQGGDGHQQE